MQIPKDDEYFALFENIIKELYHYKEYFRGKTVLCNCDNPRLSSFYRYFLIFFDQLGLKKVICTYRGSCYKTEYTGDDWDGVSTPTDSDGDFRNRVGLDEADIVVTFPPFSLFNEFMAMLMESGKKFIVLGSRLCVPYKDVFPHIMLGEIWAGVHSGEMEFTRPNGNIAIVENMTWYTNLTPDIRKESV